MFGVAPSHAGHSNSESVLKHPAVQRWIQSLAQSFADQQTSCVLSPGRHVNIMMQCSTEGYSYYVCAGAYSLTSPLLQVDRSLKSKKPCFCLLGLWRSFYASFSLLLTSLSPSSLFRSTFHPVRIEPAHRVTSIRLDTLGIWRTAHK